jgi:hypothetical protein
MMLFIEVVKKLVSPDSRFEIVCSMSLIKKKDCVLHVNVGWMPFCIGVL